MSFLGGGNVLGPHALQPITKLAAWGAAWLLSGLAGRATLQQTSHVYFVVTRADRHPRRPTAVTCLFFFLFNFGGLLEGTVPKSGKDRLPNPALSNSTKAYKVT